MRTTLDLDTDVLKLAKELAAGRKISVGKALSDLARRGSRLPLVNRNGFHVFIVDEDVPRFGPDDVRAGLDTEDVEYARLFREPKS